MYSPVVKDHRRLYAAPVYHYCVGVELPGLILVGLAIVIGLVGTIIQLYPGLPIILIAIGVWAGFTGTATAWWIFVAAAAVVIIAYVLSFVLPARYMRDEGTPWSALSIGIIFAFIGFFVLPVVGMPIGFVVGVFVSEWVRLRNPSRAWHQTVTALKGVLLSVLIELIAGALSAGLWVLGLFLT